MAPLIFTNEDNLPVLAIGGAGGNRIIPALISVRTLGDFFNLNICHTFQRI